MNFLSSKINISTILKDYFNTFKIGSKYNNADILTFFIYPAIISFIMTCYFPFSSSIENLLAVVFSVFIGMFLNLLVLLLSFNPQKHITKDNYDFYKELGSPQPLIQLVKETRASISYTVLLSCVELLLILLNSSIELACINCFIVFLIYIFFINIFLTFLMILKRVYTIYDYIESND